MTFEGDHSMNTLVLAAAAAVTFAMMGPAMTAPAAAQSVTTGVND